MTEELANTEEPEFPPEPSHEDYDPSANPDVEVEPDFDADEDDTTEESI